MIFTFIIAFLIRPNGWLYVYPYELKESIVLMGLIMDVLTLVSIIGFIVGTAGMGQ